MGRRTPRVVHHLALALLAGGGALSGLSCGGGDVQAPTTGSLEIRTATSGPEPDANGYVVSIDDGAETPLGANAVLQRDNLEPGNHSVRLAGMAANCSVEGQNPRSVAVTGDAVAEASFVITCRSTTGGLEVTSATSGPSPDPDGYSITLDGTDRGTLGVSAAVTLGGLTPGSHAVGLSGVAANCQVQGENPRTATVAAGASATVAFAITCTAPPPVSGTLRITTMTTGPDPDPSGYAFAVDGGTSQSIAVNASATVANVATGAHKVELSGVTANCTVQGNNPRSVTVSAGATADVSFAVVCITARVTRWTPMSSGTTNTLQRVSGSSATNVFVVDGSNTIRHYDGTSWSPQPAPTPVHAVWANSANDAFAVGGLRLGAFLHYDGQQWSAMTPPPAQNPPHFDEERYSESIRAVWGNSGTNVFAVGSWHQERDDQCDGSSPGAYVAHYDGISWSRISEPSYITLEDVWGTSGNDVYAVGYSQVCDTPEEDATEIVHYDGHQWSTVFREPNVFLRHVWAGGASDIYAIGQTWQTGTDAEVIRYFDGRTWSALASPTTEPLNAIWGSSANDIYLAAGKGIWHFDGASWTKVYTSESTLVDVWGSSSTDVYAVGENGTILHGTP